MKTMAELHSLSSDELIKHINRRGYTVLLKQEESFSCIRWSADIRKDNISVRHPRGYCESLKGILAICLREIMLLRNEVIE